MEWDLCLDAQLTQCTNDGVFQAFHVSSCPYPEAPEIDDWVHDELARSMKGGLPASGRSMNFCSQPSQLIRRLEEVMGLASFSDSVHGWVLQSMSKTSSYSSVLFQIDRQLGLWQDLWR